MYAVAFKDSGVVKENELRNDLIHSIPIFFWAKYLGPFINKIFEYEVGNNIEENDDYFP